jgi:DNA-binding transcriptional regulator YiaG
MGGISFAPVLGTGGKYVADSEGNIYGPKGPRKPTVHTTLRGARYQILMLHHADHSSRRIAWHRAVYAAFHGEISAGLLVRHLDGNSLNNQLSNLAVGTQADNMADAMRHGTVRAGETHPSAKLSDAQVKEVRRRYAEGGMSQRAIAAEYGVSQSLVSLLVTEKGRKESL